MSIAYIHIIELGKVGALGYRRGQRTGTRVSALLIPDASPYATHATWSHWPKNAGKSLTVNPESASLSSE